MQILILAALLLPVPAVVGGLGVSAVGKNRSFAERLAFRWVSGHIILWAGFQVICVPLVLAQKSFKDLVLLFSGFIAAMGLLAVASDLRHRERGAWRQEKCGSRKREGILLRILFWGLLLFQLVQAVRMTYADTDDAYYVAVSAITQNSNTMYQVLPYTGFGTTLDMRHCLAPFPIWVAYLAKVSGMPAVTAAHVIIPLALISMTYAIFFLIGVRLFPEKDGKLPLFLVFTELLVLFGNYSIQTVENFMIARSRQGKAALGSIVIPFVLLLLLLLCEKLREKQKIPPVLYLMLLTAAATGCLCTTIGALLLCMLVGVTGLTAAINYKRYLMLLPLAAACTPCVCVALLYLILG